MSEIKDWKVGSSWSHDGESVPCSLSFGGLLAILGFLGLYKHLPISACILTWHPPCVPVCIHIFSFYKDASRIGLGPLPPNDLIVS